jgi:hypothetical protein
MSDTRNDGLDNWAECKIQGFQNMLFNIIDRKDILSNQENNGQSEAGTGYRSPMKQRK